jgi:hypothetical protein
MPHKKLHGGKNWQHGLYNLRVILRRFFMSIGIFGFFPFIGGNSQKQALPIPRPVCYIAKNDMHYKELGGTLFRFD